MTQYISPSTVLASILASSLAFSAAVKSAESSWYLMESSDPVLEEVVTKKAVVDGTDEEGNIWQLIVQCERLANTREEPPLTIYLRTPYRDLWGGTREDGGTILAFEGRIKTDQKPSRKFKTATFSTQDSIANDEIRLSSGPLNQAAWEEALSDYRGKTLKIWPFYGYAKLEYYQFNIDINKTMTTIDLEEFYTRDKTVTINLGNFQIGDSYQSDVYISEVLDFCKDALADRAAFIAEP